MERLSLCVYCIAFGLATACYVFTELIMPVVRYLLARGTRIVLQIDDDQVLKTQKQFYSLIHATLINEGFVL